MGTTAAPAYLRSPANLQEVLREIRKMANHINSRLDQIDKRLDRLIAYADRTHPTGIDTDSDLRKRLLAVNMLLEMPEDLNAPLEAELYVLRDKLQVAALEK